jgi:hypothetical protein
MVGNRTLQHLGKTSVVVPPMVYEELWGKIGPEAPLIETALHTFVHVEQPGKIGQHVETATAHLGDGAREVIGLGTSFGHAFLPALIWRGSSEISYGNQHAAV